MAIALGMLEHRLEVPIALLNVDVLDLKTLLREILASRSGVGSAVLAEYLDFLGRSRLRHNHLPWKMPQA
jgi:hypothetical protein